MKAPTSPVQTPRSTKTRSLDEVVKEIMTLDRQTNELYTQGKQKSDPEWRRCDQRLTAIGEELYAEGGEARCGPFTAVLPERQSRAVR